MNAIVRFSRRVLLLAAAAIVAMPAQAGVIVHGTRVVYPGSEREVTVRVENLGKQPALVQAWIDDGDPSAAPENARVPFDLTPPLFRLEPGSSQSLRIMRVGGALPQDRESLYWLNVLHVPPKAQGEGRNLMQLRLRTRIKLIYRPVGLERRAAAQAPDKLSWSLVDNPDGSGIALKADNPTPYHVNFSQLQLNAGGRQFKHPGLGVAAPLSSTLLPLEGLTTKPGRAQVEFVYITDQGVLLSRTALTAP